MMAAFILLLIQPAAWAAGGHAQFDLAQVPGSYIAKTPNVQVQVKIQHPEVLQTVLDQDSPDSSPNNPTMDTDDGLTLGAHQVEIDIITNCEHASDDRSCDAGADTTVGIGKSVQVDIGKSVTFDKQTGSPGATLVNATTIGVKYNFLDKKGWAMAVYPAVSLNDATDKQGTVIYVPIMISKQINDKTTAAATIGASQSTEYQGINSMNMSLAIGRAVSEQAKVMAEVSSYRGSDDRYTYVNVGYMRVVVGNSSSRAQISAFARLGRTIGYTPEGRPRYAIRLGIAVNLQPKQQN